MKLSSVKKTKQKKNKVCILGSCAQTPAFQKPCSRLSYSSGSGLKSPFLELYEDYLRIKSGFLPRSGCL